jgi:serine/threonine protein kinase
MSPEPSDPPTPPKKPTGPGEFFGSYELLELLGRGGMGEVWRAHDTVRGRIVALKRLPHHLRTDSQLRERFYRECRGAAQLTEAHVVPIHDFGEIDGQLFLDMRLIDGPNLAQILAERGPLPVPLAVHAITQVAAALDAAHAIGLVHRDVKPANILVDQDGAALHCYLADFGVSATSGAGTNASMTKTGVVIGTLDYIAPERLSEQPTDKRVDIYSLACLFYEVLTAKPPFQRDGIAELCSAHLFQPPPRPSQTNPAVPEPFDGVVARGMAKQPSDRHASAGAFAREASSAAARAAAYVGSPSVPAFTGPVTTGTMISTVRRPPGRAVEPASEASRPRKALSQRLRSASRRTPVRVVALSGALVLAAGGGWLSSSHPRPERVQVVAEPAGIPGQGAFIPATLETTTASPSTASQPPADPPAAPPKAPSVERDERGRVGLLPARNTVSGNEAGLYAAPTAKEACDPAALPAFFAAHADRAAAWAAAQDMSAANIASFVGTLTPVVLRTDTVVINHRFGDGRAQPFPSVLQAGTGVLIDEYGVPRVRCASGNPLKKSADDVILVYPDAPWENFTPDRVAMIEPCKVAVSVFVIVNITTQPDAPPVLQRPIGTSGTNDEPASAIQTQEATSFDAPGNTESTISTPPSNGPEGGIVEDPVTDETESSSATEIPPVASPESSTAAETSPADSSESPRIDPDPTETGNLETTYPAAPTTEQPALSDASPSTSPSSAPEPASTDGQAAEGTPETPATQSGTGVE